MLKPVMKRTVGIVRAIEKDGIIVFSGPAALAREAGDYGYYEYPEGVESAYVHLRVDPRYDFYDVLQWIEEWEE